MKNLITTFLLTILLKFSALGQCSCYTAHGINIIGLNTMELILSNTCDNNVYLNFYVISTVFPFDTLARQDNFGGAILPLNTIVSSILNTNLVNPPALGTYRVSLTNGTLVCDSVQFSQTLDIEHIESDVFFRIYPNPFSSETFLEIDANLQNITLTVYDNLGQLVKQIISNTSGTAITFHRENLSNGIYFVRLSQGNKVIAKRKIVITN